ncbi:MAG TPA: hypothetical protein VGO55_10970 [Allosphingosinicella sp.]|jgi:hypothetical protein|nr:hypothetical protein [Allosphingosinicella sp.]
MLHAAIALAALSVPAWEPVWSGDYLIESSCGSYTRPSYSYRGTLRIARGANETFYALTWETDRGAFVGSAVSVQGQLLIEFRRPDGEGGLMIASFAPNGMLAQGGVRGTDLRCSERWRPAA